MTSNLTNKIVLKQPFRAKKRLSVRSSASEVTTLWRYKNLFIIIIIPSVHTNTAAGVIFLANFLLDCDTISQKL